MEIHVDSTTIDIVYHLIFLLVSFLYKIADMLLITHAPDGFPGLGLAWVLPNLILLGSDYFEMRVLEMGFNIRHSDRSLRSKPKPIFW